MYYKKSIQNIPPIVIRDFELIEGIVGFVVLVVLNYVRLPHINIYGKIAMDFIVAWILRKFGENAYNYIKNKYNWRSVGLFVFTSKKPYPHIDYINDKLYK